jgi:hypothetical protein
VGRVYVKVICRFARDFDVFLLKMFSSGGRRLAFDIPLESVYLFLHLKPFTELIILWNVEYMLQNRLIIKMAVKEHNYIFVKTIIYQLHVSA